MAEPEAQSIELVGVFRTAGPLPLSCDLRERKAHGSQKEQRWCLSLRVFCVLACPGKRVLGLLEREFLGSLDVARVSGKDNKAFRGWTVHAEGTSWPSETALFKARHLLPCQEDRLHLILEVVVQAGAPDATWLSLSMPGVRPQDLPRIPYHDSDGAAAFAPGVWAIPGTITYHCH